MEKLKVTILMSFLAGLIFVNVIYGANQWSSLVVEIILWIIALRYVICYIKGLHHLNDVKRHFIPQDMKICGEKIHFTVDAKASEARASVRLKLKPLEPDALVDVKVVFRYLFKDIDIVSHAALAALSEEQEVVLPLNEPEEAQTLLYALEQGQGRYMLEITYSCRAGQRIKKICELSPQIKDHKVWKDILEQTNTPDATRIEKAVHLLCKAWILTAMHL